MTPQEYREITGRMSKPRRDEHNLQEACVKYFDATRKDSQRLFHINNKAKNAIEGAKFKRMGVRKGIADFCLICDKGTVVWIELKKSDGRQSKEQKAFQTLCADLGHQYVIVRDLVEFIGILTKYV